MPVIKGYIGNVTYLGDFDQKTQDKILNTLQELQKERDEQLHNNDQWMIAQIEQIDADFESECLAYALSGGNSIMSIKKDRDNQVRKVIDKRNIMDKQTEQSYTDAVVKFLESYTRR